MKTLAGMTLLGLVLGFSLPVRAETVDVLTYYPVSAESEEAHFSSLTVGDAYRTETPGDGTALIAESLGIGTTAPAGPLHVVGVQDNASSVVFVAGAETPALGSPKILVGIGTETPTQAPSPENGLATGNLDVNDVYVRALGQWASGITGGGGTGEPIVTGTYTGNGGTQTISTGITPKLVLTATNSAVASFPYPLFIKYTGMPGSSAQVIHRNTSNKGTVSSANSVQVLSGGFQVSGPANANGNTYSYFAVS